MPAVSDYRFTPAVNLDGLLLLISERGALSSAPVRLHRTKRIRALCVTCITVCYNAYRVTLERWRRVVSVTFAMYLKLFDLKRIIFVTQPCKFRLLKELFRSDVCSIKTIMFRFLCFLGACNEHRVGANLPPALRRRRTHAADEPGLSITAGNAAEGILGALTC